MKELASMSTLERLSAYYGGDESIMLSPKEEETLARWESAWTFLRETKNTEQSVTALMKLFPGISKSMAFRDVQNARQLFGDVVRYSSEAMKALVNEYTIDLLRRAKAANDRTTEAKALMLLIKANGLERPLDEQGEPPAIQQITINVPAELIQIGNILLSQGDVNLMAMRERLPKSYDRTDIQPAAISAGDGSAS